MLKYFIILFTSFLSILSKINSIIVLPFEVKSKKTSNIYENKQYYLTTEYEIGEPPQKINSELTFDESYFTVSNESKYVIPSFNITLSKTINESSPNIWTNSQISRKFCKDTVYFYTDLQCKKKTKFDSMSFLFVFDKNDKNKLYSSKIGLQTCQNYSKDFMLIYILNSMKIINNYCWSLKFNNLNKGLLIIGKPHEYDPKNYDIKDLTNIKNNVENTKNIYWSLKFTGMKIKTELLNENINARIEPNNIGIIVTYKQLYIIEKNFFIKYEEANVCEKEVVFTGNYSYYQIKCIKGFFTKKDINKFPIVSFYNNLLNYSFEFEGEDLFTEEGNKIVFQIIAEIGPTREWIIGRVFMLKYQLIFDEKNQLISFYSKKNKINNFGMFKWVVLVFCIIVFIFVAFVFYRKINMKRKQKANELEDNFSYIPHNQQNKLYEGSEAN